jgi:predicted nuclease with TOPRIM domain
MRSAISAVPHRVLVLSMDPSDAVKLGEIGAAVLGGGLGVKLLDRLFAWHKRKASEPVELTAKILDDGDKLRELLLEEAKTLRAEKDTVTERAHRAELELAALRPEVEKLRARLDRKDEQCKALQAQILALGATPLVVTGSSGRGDGSR